MADLVRDGLMFHRRWGRGASWDLKQSQWSTPEARCDSDPTNLTATADKLPSKCACVRCTVGHWHSEQGVALPPAPHPPPTPVDHWHTHNRLYTVAQTHTLKQWTPTGRPCPQLQVHDWDLLYVLNRRKLQFICTTSQKSNFNHNMEFWKGVRCPLENFIC